MEYLRFGDRLQVRLESGDEAVESLTRLAEKESLSYAALSGLGALRTVTLGFFEPESREYEKHDIEEQMEVTALIGNVALRDGRPFLHLHAALARRDLSMIGGHVFRGRRPANAGDLAADRGRRGAAAAGRGVGTGSAQPARPALARVERLRSDAWRKLPRLTVALCR